MNLSAAEGVEESTKTAEGDEERTKAPIRIPPWVLPPEETKKLFEDGHGTSPDHIYAREMPTTYLNKIVTNSMHMT